MSGTQEQDGGQLAVKALCLVAIGGDHTHLCWLQVRGILSEDEVLMAKTIGYLKGVHVVIATPQCLVEVAWLPDVKSLFMDLKAIAVDEVDACFKVNTSLQAA